MKQKDIQKVMRHMGALGGHASARALSAQERRARARKAGKARQAKARQKKAKQAQAMKERTTYVN